MALTSDSRRRRVPGMGRLAAGNGGQCATASTAFRQSRQRGFCKLQIL